MVRCDNSQSLATIVLESDTQTEYGCEVECKIDKKSSERNYANPRKDDNG